MGKGEGVGGRGVGVGIASLYCKYYVKCCVIRPAPSQDRVKIFNACYLLGIVVDRGCQRDFGPAARRRPRKRLTRVGIRGVGGGGDKGMGVSIYKRWEVEQ